MNTNEQDFPMTFEELEAYRNLLKRAWHQTPAGTLPANHYVLAAWSGLPLRKWRRAKVRVLAAFVLKSDGRLHQKSMYEEFLRAKAKHQGGVK